MLSFLHLSITIPIPLRYKPKQFVPSYKPTRNLILYPKSYILHSTHYRLTLCLLTASSTVEIVHYTQNSINNTTQSIYTSILIRYLNSCLLYNFAIVISCDSQTCLVLIRVHLFSKFVLLSFRDFLTAFGCEWRYLLHFCIMNVMFLNSVISPIVLLLGFVING